MFSTISFLVVFCLLLSAANADGDSHSLASIQRDCHFTLGDQEFDLCPVFKAQVKELVISFEKWTPPTVTKTEYTIGLGSALKKNETVPDHEQCPDGARVCLKTSNRRPRDDSEPERVLQVVPVAGNIHWQWQNNTYGTRMNATAQLGKTLSKHPAVQLRLHGGFYVRQQQRALISFICDHGAEEPTYPSYSWNWNGTHAFSWSTKHACGKQLQAPPPPPPEDDQPSDNEPQPEPGPEEPDLPPEDDGAHLTEPFPPADAARRRSMTVIVLMVASPIILLTYLLYSPPLFFRRLVLKTSKRLGLKLHPRFRVAESRLVRWAQSDIDFDSLDNDDEDDDEDLMVNQNARSRPGKYGTETLDDEQIPLAPSPKRTSFANYGSAVSDGYR